MVGFGKKSKQFCRNEKLMTELIQPVSSKTLNYIGPSMNPIFKAGDRLKIISNIHAKIRAGDVVVFISPDDGSKVVHRVVSVNSDGIRTRGDNCNHEDDWVLRREHILGQVVAAQRGKRRRRVFGGRIGQLFGLAIRAIHAIEASVSSGFRPTYDRLAMAGVFRRWLPTKMRTRVLSFDRAAGTELQLVMGRRVIGRWLPGRTGWSIRRPFRLFVDEESLPENLGKGSVVRGQVSVVDEASKDNLPLNLATKIVSEKVSASQKVMQGIHPSLKLCGPTDEILHDLSDELLTYVRSVLKDESPLAPEASVDAWSSLLTFLQAHWIIPFAYRKIGSLPQECRPPEAITDEMRQDFLLSCVRSIHMERQLREIIEAFREQSVRVLVLRGPALAFSLYPDPAMRPSGDLDLLVMPEQVVQARGILESLGYTCLAKRFEVARDFFREECFIDHNNRGNKFPVDLHWVHWELHPFFKGSEEVDIQDLFQRAWKVETPTLTFETPHPVDYLIHSAIHLVMIHKNEMRLSWIYDTRLLAQHLHVPDDWKTLQERSVAWRARLPLEHCLKMAQVWAGLELPDGFDDFSTWPRPTEDESAVWADTLHHHWVTILLKRSLANPSIILKRVPSLIRLLFPHPDIVRFCYPTSSKWLLPVSYVRRWFRWIDDLVITRIGELKQKG